MERSRLRRRYEAIVRAVQVPVPFSLDEFCARVARYRDRQLRLHPIQVGSLAGFCGLYVELDGVDHATFPRTPPPSINSTSSCMSWHIYSAVTARAEVASRCLMECSTNCSPASTLDWFVPCWGEAATPTPRNGKPRPLRP